MCLLVTSQKNLNRGGRGDWLVGVIGVCDRK